MKNNAEIAMATIAILLIVVGGAGAGTYVAYDQGYIPIKELLPYREPPETHSDPITPDDTPDPGVNKTSCCQIWFNLLVRSFPAIETDMKYQLYKVDFVGHTPYEIFAKYLTQLEKEGFKATEPSTGTAGKVWEVSWNGYNIICGLCVEGWTFVFVMITQCPSDPTGISEEDMTYCILYLTGDIGVYKKTFDGTDFMAPSLESVTPGVDE